MTDIKQLEPKYELTGNEFVEAQTKAIEREFKCSRPQPRNRAMGFKGNHKKRASSQYRLAISQYWNVWH